MQHFVALDRAGEMMADIGMLDTAEAARLSREFLDFHPLLQALGGIVLTDADTSDHHVLVTVPSLAGQILFLSHDGDSRIVFADGQTFLDEARRAVAEHSFFDERHPEISPLAADQVGLQDLIVGTMGTADADDVIVPLIPSLSLTDVQFMMLLAAEGGLFIPEAVAREIARRPALHLIEVAQQCAASSHAQVSAAGAKALLAVQQLP